MSPRQATPTVLPMQFTDPEAAHRARERSARLSAEEDNAAFARSQEHAALMHAHRHIGRDEGHTAGFKLGYKGGFNWGFTCGAICTTAAATIILLCVKVG
jgi:hypothetical protein